MVGGAFDQVANNKVFGAPEPYLPLSACPMRLVPQSGIDGAGHRCRTRSADLYVPTDAPDLTSQ